MRHLCPWRPKQSEEEPVISVIAVNLNQEIQILLSVQFSSSGPYSLPFKSSNCHESFSTRTSAFERCYQGVVAPDLSHSQRARSSQQVYFCELIWIYGVLCVWLYMCPHPTNNMQEDMPAARGHSWNEKRHQAKGRSAKRRQRNKWSVEAWNELPTSIHLGSALQYKGCQTTRKVFCQISTSQFSQDMTGQAWPSPPSLCYKKWRWLYKS